MSVTFTHRHALSLSHHHRVTHICNIRRVWVWASACVCVYYLRQSVSPRNWELRLLPPPRPGQSSEMPPTRLGPHSPDRRRTLPPPPPPLPFQEMIWGIQGLEKVPGFDGVMRVFVCVCVCLWFCVIDRWIDWLEIDRLKRSSQGFIDRLRKTNTDTYIGI